MLSRLFVQEFEREVGEPVVVVAHPSARETLQLLFDEPGEDDDTSTVNVIFGETIRRDQVLVLTLTEAIQMKVA